MHSEKDNKIVTLQKQLDLLTQSNEDMSDNSAKTAEQMTELCNALDERDQRISHLELNLSDGAEEKELLKSEMANQTQELVNQVKDLRAKLEEVPLYSLFLISSTSMNCVIISAAYGQDFNIRLLKI